MAGGELGLPALDVELALAGRALGVEAAVGGLGGGGLAGLAALGGRGVGGGLLVVEEAGVAAAAVRAEAAGAGHRVELGVVELPGEAGEGEGEGADPLGELVDGGAALELPAVAVQQLVLGRGFEERDLLEVGGGPGGGPAFAGAGELLPGRGQVEQPAAARDPGEGLAELGGDGLDAAVLIDEVARGGSGGRARLTRTLKTSSMARASRTTMPAHGPSALAARSAGGAVPSGTGAPVERR